jgi:hypothetical protein
MEYKRKRRAASVEEISRNRLNINEMSPQKQMKFSQPDLENDISKLGARIL